MLTCLFLGEFAFDFDFKIGFGFATGEHGDSCFGADFNFEFEVEFFDFDDR